MIRDKAFITVKTEWLGPDESDVARAVEILRSGGAVAFPTETVYGLGADATDGAAVARLYQAKGRPSFNPLIAHVSDFQAAARLIALDPIAERLAQAFWPGPLTLVGTMRPDCPVSTLARAGLPTLAVRVPAHDLARRLLSRAGIPVAAPSANPSGAVSPTTAEHVRLGLEGRIAAILDAGSCEVGLESTIVRCTNGAPELLRPGGISLEDLERVAGTSISYRTSGTISAPGQLESHYAPRSTLKMNVTAPQGDEMHLGFAGVGPAETNLSPTGDLNEAAAALFDWLHRLDARSDGRTIAVAPVPEAGLGLAINDRLRRAAAAR